MESLSNLRALLARTTAALLPQACFVCGADAAGEPLCARCSGQLPWQLAPACPRCALPTAGGLLCGHCQRRAPAFDATRAVFDYRFPVDRMVQGLKYHRRLALAGYFARCLAAAPPPPGAALVVPMPLHRARLCERGFNQAVEIARPLARAWGLPLALDVVRRLHDTPAQAGLPRAARMRNMRGAFTGEGTLAGLSVVVVDDVMTTGASLEALARTLKRMGVQRVENRIIARTP